MAQKDERTAALVERLESVTLAGEHEDRSAIPSLLAALDDTSYIVRKAALQALVLEIGEKTEEVTEHCWRLLAEDPSDQVRSMAAACLGSILWKSHSLESFDRLVARLREERASGLPRLSIFESLSCVVGAPPTEWPFIDSTPADILDFEPNWSEVARLRARLLPI